MTVDLIKIIFKLSHALILYVQDNSRRNLCQPSINKDHFEGRFWASL